MNINRMKMAATIGMASFCMVSQDHYMFPSSTIVREKESPEDVKLISRCDALRKQKAEEKRKRKAERRIRNEH